MSCVQAIGILQGRCVGGSTTVNWTSSFRTPSATHQNAWSARSSYFYVVSTSCS